MNNKQVACRWSLQTTAKGSGSHFYFEGATIYSYGPHFPVATFIDRQTVFVTTKTYSSSTARHVSITRQALFSGPSVFHVPYLSGDRHEENYKAYVDRMEELAAQASRARSTLTRVILLNEFSRLTAECAAYRARFLGN